MLACGGLLASAPASAQLNSPSRRRPPPASKSKIAIEREKSAQKQMLVQAHEINYDYTNHRVAAVGNVQIYYGGSTIEADKVIYDQTTKRLHAEGNVRLTEEDGKVTYGEIMDLSDDYRDGFVDSLRLDAPEQTRMAAARAERSSGNFTVFHNGVYTACAPCKDDPKKPPLWQVKAARIIHDQGEKMIYFEDAHLEFFGKPLAWLPYFSAPDPTVKRKTGFLMPSVSSSTIYGGSVRDPLLLGAGTGLRRDVRADDHHQAGSAAAGRIPPAPDQRRLLDPRRRHLSAGQELLPGRPRLSRLPRQRGNRRPVRDQRQMGVGLGRRDVDRQDLPARLQPASVGLSRHRSVRRPPTTRASRSSTSPAKATAAISTPAASIISASRPRTRRPRSRSSIR